MEIDFPIYYDISIYKNWESNLSNILRNMTTKEMSVAWVFYPSDPNKIWEMIKWFLKNANLPEYKVWQLKAIVCPHAWYIYSWQVAWYSYKLLQYELSLYKENSILDQEFTLPTILLLCPSHYEYFKWVSIWMFDEFKTPIGNLKVDINLGKKILATYDDDFVFWSKAFAQEHSLETQLPFLKFIEPNIKILPMIFGQTNPLEIWNIIDELIKDKNIIIVVSSDLSHFHKYNEAIQLDKNTLQSFLDLDTEKIINKWDACGIYPWLSLHQIASNRWRTTKLLKYQNSWDSAWDKQRVVWYGSMGYFDITT